MDLFSGNNAFSAADIERYHRGLMAPAERHALEKAALEDPFLADALEGYGYTSTPAADLQGLRARLQKKTEHRPRGGLFFLRSTWMRAAALVLVIAGSGWLAWRLITPEQKTVAFTPARETASEPRPDEAPATATTPMADSTSVGTALTPQNSKPETATTYTYAQPLTTEEAQVSADRGATAADTLPANRSQWAGNYSTNTALERVELNTNLNRATPPDLGRGANYKRSGPMLNNRSADYTNNAYARRNALPMNTSPAAPSVRLDSSSMGRPDLAKTGEMDANLRFKDGSKQDTINNFNVVLQEQKAELNEVVVVSSGYSKKPAQKAKVLMDTLEGADYYGRFDDYVADHLRKPEELRTKPRSGEVELTFDINRQGEPVNIRVTKSLCESCDEEAIRLLKEGPKWKKKKDKRRKVRIKF